MSPTIVALQTGDIQSDALPPELAWVANLNLSNPDISELLRMRTNGFEYYAPALQQLSQLTPKGQAFIANALVNGIGGPDISDETIKLIQDLRVPESLRIAILEEAKANGADPDWDIPAFDEALQELRTGGNTGAETLGDLFQYAPQKTSRLYIVIVSQALLEENRAAHETLRDAQGRLVDAQGRLVDAQGRLVDVQGRLVDAQGRLLSIDNAIDSADQILNSN